MQAAVDLLRQSKRLLIVSHISPDGDAIASVLALTLGLQQLGKEITPVLVDAVPAFFHFLPQYQLIKQ